jgi:hypothetical protein
VIRRYAAKPYMVGEVTLGEHTTLSGADNLRII